MRWRAAVAAILFTVLVGEAKGGVGDQFDILHREGIAYPHIVGASFANGLHNIEANGCLMPFAGYERSVLSADHKKRIPSVRFQVFCNAQCLSCKIIDGLFLHNEFVGEYNSTFSVMGGLGCSHLVPKGLHFLFESELVHSNQKRFCPYPGVKSGVSSFIFQPHRQRYASLEFIPGDAAVDIGGYGDPWSLGGAEAIPQRV